MFSGFAFESGSRLNCYIMIQHHIQLQLPLKHCICTGTINVQTFLPGAAGSVEGRSNTNKTPQCY